MEHEGPYRLHNVLPASPVLNYMDPTHDFHTISLTLGAFVNQLLKVSISVSPSVRLHATTRLPLVGFLRNSIFRIFFFFFAQPVSEFQVWLISDKNSQNFTCISMQVFIGLYNGVFSARYSYDRRNS